MTSVTLDLPEFYGYEYTGEFRIAEEGEYYYGTNGFQDLKKSMSRSNGFVFILKPKRWRAEKGETYYYVCLRRCIVVSELEDGYTIDNNLWESGNYFKTMAEAETYLNEFKEILSKRKLS